MSAFATTIISGLVLVVAFMQWRTAHQKVLLDLFDRRFRVYNDVGNAMDEFFSGSSTETVIAARLALLRPSSQATFLFGPEVSEQIALISQQMGDLTFKIRKKDAADLDYEARNQLISEIVELDGRLDSWREPFTRLCNPYLRMDQKIVRTPTEWLRDRNRIRLSHADEKQK